MKSSNSRFMESDDERQYMINEDFEIFEKYGVPTGALQIHYHNFYEILYIAEGEFASFVDNTTYALKKGDFLLIDRNRLHHYHYMEKRHDSSRRILIWITKDFLNALSGADVDFTACFSIQGSPAYHFPAHHEDKLANYLYKLILNDSSLTEYSPETKLLERAYLTLFFVYLNRLCLRPSFQFTQEETTYNPMTKTVFDYIDSHITEPITVDELAQAVSLSKYHFLRTFKSITGMTAHDFIIKKRLIRACEEIWNGCPLTEVYQKCGFTDYSSFFRNFKNTYGIPPKDFKTYFERESRQQ